MNRVANIGVVNRVFSDVDEDMLAGEKEITEETGMEDPNAEEELPDGYSIDEDGTEWFEKMKMVIGGIEKKVKMTGSHTMNEPFDSLLKTKKFTGLYHITISETCILLIWEIHFS